MVRLAAASSTGRRHPTNSPSTARGRSVNEHATEEDVPHRSVKTTLLKKTDDIVCQRTNNDALKQRH
jgi:hypothetical protein